MSKSKASTDFPFKMGETVVEPTIGICQVAGLRRMTVDGVEEDYYIFQAGNAKVLVPKSQIPKRGIRRPMTKDEVKKIFALLRVPVSPNRNDARLQYTSYRDIMKSGDPQKITRLLRDLFTLDQYDELKGKEKEIMEQAKKFLCDEITHIRGASKTQVMETVNEALRQMYKKKVQKDKEKGRKIAPGYPSYELDDEEEKPPTPSRKTLLDEIEVEDIEEAIEEEELEEEIEEEEDDDKA